jgi:hypothetical protein
MLLRAVMAVFETSRKNQRLARAKLMTNSEACAILPKEQRGRQQKSFTRN